MLHCHIAYIAGWVFWCPLKFHTLAPPRWTPLQGAFWPEWAAYRSVRVLLLLSPAVRRPVPGTADSRWRCPRHLWLVTYLDLNHGVGLLGELEKTQREFCSDFPCGLKPVSSLLADFLSFGKGSGEGKNCSFPRSNVLLILLGWRVTVWLFKKSLTSSDFSIQFLVAKEKAKLQDFGFGTFKNYMQKKRFVM